jgi:hypothetical protein
LPSGRGKRADALQPFSGEEPQGQGWRFLQDIGWTSRESVGEKIKSAGANIAMISGDETGSVSEVLAAS